MKGIRTTEIRKYVMVNGEAGMVTVLEQLAERVAAMEQTIAEMGMMQLQMVKIIQQVTDGAGAMRKQVEKMQGIGEDDDLPMASQ